MRDVKNGYQATPNATLEQQMMDACAPKNEREWWAFAEIGRLRAEVASLTAQLQSGESFHAVAVRQRDAAWGEVEKLKATLTQQCKGFRADVEKLEAEVEALKVGDALHKVCVQQRDQAWREVESLRAKAAAFDEWLAKTEWVQETAEAGELGTHRADVMRKRIEALRAALKPFAAIDLTTNQAVDAMDVLRARRALGRE